MSSQALPSQSQRHSSANSSAAIRSPQQRKEFLRNAYATAQALQNNVNIRTIEYLEETIQEVDIINREGTMEDKIKGQGEVILDSEIMTVSSNVLKKCTYSLSENVSSYDPAELAQKIKNHVCRLPDTVMEVDPEWSLLGKYIMKYFKKIAPLTMILGTLKPIPKKDVTVRRRVVREAQAPTRRPEKVIALEKVEDSVEQTIVEIKKIIVRYNKEHKKPLDFFALVLNPTDFGKTIENILHTSFLIRDGQIKFLVDEDGIPAVQKSSKEASEGNTNKKKKNIQNVLSLNMKQWKALVRAYGMKKPMIDMQSKSIKK